MGGIRVRRRSIHAEVSGGKIAAKLLAKDEPHKLNVSVETELTCLRLQSHPSISAADKYTMKVSSPQVINKVLKYSQQTVDTVLKAHDTHEADDCFSHPAQTTVRFDVSVKTAELESVTNDRDARFRHTSAFHGEPFVRFVRDDNMIGKTASQLLQPYEHAIDHRVSAPR